MYFIKKINNNVALAKDENNVEWILLGKGIGFGKKTNDLLDQTEIDRRFKALEEFGNHQAIANMVGQIDGNIFQLASEVSDQVAAFLGIRFSNYNYLALADHLSFALERTQNGNDYPNEFRWEVQNLYPKEYQAAEMSLKFIEQRIKVALPQSELTFFTYHYVNAQNKETQIEDTIELTAMINQVLEIISYHFQKKLAVNSMNYARFLTHLRYFMIRQLNNDLGGSDLDPMISTVIKEKYPRAYQAAKKIQLYLKKSRNWDISHNEMMYLTLHIWRLTRE
ncbi:PRD domain-containing protein [Latilactobacillus graminis]|uniref:Transcription antiterminator n=2 Tax=Latilactobacillus graminis TaxID=60519 RepID=A0AA89I325_9LACO|nr:PRD domain-containing protein [Latilactobacillus graminis]KRM24534.1 transcription antiterminator [Latilactobacillus graminis DSM 20719]QFP79012.1 PRD domain-containing protein [Latilactobacillus graminis]